MGLTVTQLVLLNPQLVNNPGKTCKVAVPYMDMVVSVPCDDKD